tara:strand:- start:389 stop:1087 length:699 start_codon:yes stop_codon:yes gene_type:complete
MQLLNTTASNTKIAKSQDSMANVRIASLSLYPDDVICPARHVAGCAKPCLVSAGRGSFSNVIEARKKKSQYWHDDRERFLAQLRTEMHSFIKSCKRKGVTPVFRLNTISDIRWEKFLDMEGEFGDALFYDYTKLADRLKKIPSNYKLMFSYSNRLEFQRQVGKALATNVPMTVVFRNGFPKTFLGRVVIDGDKSDLYNSMSGNVIVGLRAKGKAKSDDSDFVVDNPDLIHAA